MKSFCHSTSCFRLLFKISFVCCKNFFLILSSVVYNLYVPYVYSAIVYNIAPICFASGSVALSVAV